jgi:hypothetical protein
MKNARETVTNPVSLPPLVQQSNISNKEVSSSDDMQRTVSDFTEEDFNRDLRTQATGFLGGHSEIAWLYRLRRELEQSQRSATTGQETVSQDQRTYRDSITTMNYSADESDLPIDMNVDVFDVPPWKIAGDLVNRYFHIVHPSFPIISRTLFVKQFTSFYSKTDVRPGKRWLAILNLILAIASRYRGLVYGDNGKGEHYDDLKYFCRAWKLNTADFALANHPNLQQVQVEGLTSFYLLSIGQVNRYDMPPFISTFSVLTLLPLGRGGSAVCQCGQLSQWGFIFETRVPTFHPCPRRIAIGFGGLYIH